GKLDDIFLYNRALSSGEIGTLAGNSTVLSVNGLYEKNLTTSDATLHYQLGGKDVAFKTGSTLYYLSADHLGSSSVVMDSAGSKLSEAKYTPFGGRRTNSIWQTDELFT